MLSVANKSFKLCVIMLNVVILSVVMMNVVLLNVLVPNTVQDIMRRHHLRFSQKNRSCQYTLRQVAVTIICSCKCLFTSQIYECKKLYRIDLWVSVLTPSYISRDMRLSQHGITKVSQDEEKEKENCQTVFQLK